MPRKTTPRTGRRPRRRTMRTCSTISQAARLRVRPSRPVAQKTQASAQPDLRREADVYFRRRWECAPLRRARRRRRFIN